jgi:hypothetical protein
VFIFNEPRLELEAGTIGKVNLKKKDEYYIRYEYFEKSTSGKIIISDPITLYLQPDIHAHRFIVSAPPANPSGMATVTFLNSFDETVRVYVINNNNEYGYIGSFDDTRGAAEKNSVITPHGSDTFVVPATKYKIEVRKTDNAGTVLYTLDYIDLLATIESSTIELSPDMVNTDKRQRVGATMYYPKNISPDAMPLTPVFEIQFSASMIVPLAASNLALAALENPRIKIPLKLTWSDDNKKLLIQPAQELDYDTECSLTLGLDVRDRQGNYLARAGNWPFATVRKNAPAPKELPPATATVKFAGDKVSEREQSTVVQSIRQGIQNYGTPLVLNKAKSATRNNHVYEFIVTLWKNEYSTSDLIAYNVDLAFARDGQISVTAKSFEKKHYSVDLLFGKFIAEYISNDKQFFQDVNARLENN